MKITIPARPEPLELDTGRSALIVVDMQNAFCKKGGMMDYFRMMDPPAVKRIIDMDKKVIEAFREKEIRIIYLRMTYLAGDDANPESPFYWKEAGLKAVRDNPELKGRFLYKGSRDREIIDELKPDTKDIIIDKSRFSGFTNTELDARLKEHGIKYLFFAGLYTNICVESTLRDAFFHEYFPVMIEDACGNMGPGYTQEATVFNVTRAFGWVTTVREVLNALK